MSDDALAAQIRDILTRRVPDDPCITYRELAEQLDLPPPGTIRRVADTPEPTDDRDVLPLASAQLSEYRCVQSWPPRQLTPPTVPDVHLQP